VARLNGFSMHACSLVVTLVRFRELKMVLTASEMAEHVKREG
jgi:hypothetical protein